MAWPPEAAASFTTANGANRLWLERLSSCTTSEVLLPEEELELLELEELLLDEELEVTPEEEELEELLLDEEAAPELDELLLELLLEELLDEEDELELEELLSGSLTTVQVGIAKLPSWVPWKPKMLVEVLPGAGFCQLGKLSVNWKLVPGLVPDRVAFHVLVIVTCSGKTTENIKASVRLTVPVLVTLTSNWKDVPAVLDGVSAQVCAANA
jgi:hypothetical protein